MAVYVRDEQSKVSLFRNFMIEAEIVPDVVFSYSELASDSQQKKDIFLYGITTLHRVVKYNFSRLNARVEYYEYLKNQISSIQKETGWMPVVIYSDRNDYCEAVNFQNYLEREYHEQIEVGAYGCLGEFLSLIRSSRVVYTPRMHTCIFSLLNGIDNVPIVISPKIQQFVDLYYRSPIFIEQLKYSVEESFIRMLECE